MKKIFLSILMVALAAISANAEVLLSYNGTSTLPDGITIDGTTVVTTAKIHNNKDAKDCIQLKNGYSTEGAYNGNAIILSVADGFKAGDVVSITGFFNNSDETKVSKATVFTFDAENKISVVGTTEQFINGRTSADDPVAQTITLDADAEKIYIGRTGSTGTNILALSVSREAQADTTYYLVDAEATATYNGSAKTATFKDQTVKTFTKNGVLCATIPAASITGTFSPMPLPVTFTLPETTIEGLQKDEAGNISLADGAAPVIDFTVSVATATVPGTANVKNVKGTVDAEGKLNLTVNADYSATYGTMNLAGGLTVVYTTAASTTGINNSTVATIATKTVKTIENGNVVIVKNGKKYSVAGALLK